MDGHEDDETLRRKARALICAGVLPGQPPSRLWGGRGSGSPCAICARAIESSDFEFELEFGEAEAGEGEGTLLVHARCFNIWDRERSRELAGGTVLDPVTPAV